MTISRVQTFTDTAYGTTSNSATSASAVTAGNLLEVATFTMTGTAGAAIAVPTAPGYTFTQIATVTTNSNITTVFWAIAPSTGVVTVTITQSSANEIDLVCGEYSGVATSSPVVQYAPGNNVFAGATATMSSNTTAGNLITFSGADSFGSMVKSLSSQGTVNAGINNGYDNSTSRGADWQIAAAAALTGTEQGGFGYNSEIVVEYAAAGAGGGVSDLIPMSGTRNVSNLTYLRMLEEERVMRRHINRHNRRAAREQGRILWV